MRCICLSQPNNCNAGSLLCGLIVAFSSLLKYLKNNVSFLCLLGDVEFCPCPEFLLNVVQTARGAYQNRYYQELREHNSHSQNIRT